MIVNNDHRPPTTTRDEVVPFWHGQELFLGTPTKWRAKPF
ncbi:unnamed protein product, partial [Ectocarpus fasciculatus]